MFLREYETVKRNGSTQLLGYLLQTESPLYLLVDGCIEREDRSQFSKEFKVLYIMNDVPQFTELQCILHAVICMPHIKWLLVEVRLGRVPIVCEPLIASRLKAVVPS